VKIDFKFQSLGKISNISTSGPPPQFQNWFGDIFSRFRVLSAWDKRPDRRTDGRRDWHLVTAHFAMRLRAE